jgi:hypothetical protein
MVSRVYQPVYSTSRVNQPATKQTAVVNDAPKQSSVDSAKTDAFTSQQPKRERPDLATLRDQAEGRRIRLDSVLTDFETTLNALGIPEETTQQLQPYITVVRLQGQEPKPNIPLMKATLVSASKALDQFIAQATGKPSDVVEQWMQSLLAQDVDYQAVSQPAWSPTRQTTAQIKPNQVKQWVIAAKDQPAETAIPLLHQALAASDQPDTQRRIHGLLAKRYWALAEKHDATHHLAQSLALQTDPGKQAKQRVLLGHWHHQMKQPEQVKAVLAPLWTTNQLNDLETLSQARAKLDYGHAIAQEQPEAGIPLLIDGIKQGFSQKAWVKQALPALASAYLATGNTRDALRSLQQLAQLEKT